MLNDNQSKATSLQDLSVSLGAFLSCISSAFLEAEGWLSHACSANGQHCLLCLRSTELQAVAASQFWRSWHGQLPSHALCLHNSPTGKVPWVAMSDHSWQTCPHSPIALQMAPEAPGPGSYFCLSGKGHLATQLCYLMPSPRKHVEMLVLSYRVSARGKQIHPAEELWEAAGSENSWRCSSQIHRAPSHRSALVEETLILWLTSDSCWAWSQSARALAGTSFPPCPGPKLQAWLGRKRAGFQCPSPSLMRCSWSLHFNEELGRQWWESTGKKKNRRNLWAQ